jgi:hypothetical protein
VKAVEHQLMTPRESGEGGIPHASTTNIQKTLKYGVLEKPDEIL